MIVHRDDITKDIRYHNNYCNVLPADTGNIMEFDEGWETVRNFSDSTSNLDRRIFKRNAKNI